MDENLLQEAYQQWEDFISTLTEEEKQGSENLLDAVDGNALHYLAVAKNYTRFDQIVNRLPSKYLYEEEVIVTIYNCYLERGLHELAFDYLNKATNYFSNKKISLPKVVSDLRDIYPDEQTIQKLKLMLGNLPSQRPDDIPKILPNNLNG